MKKTTKILMGMLCVSTMMMISSCAKDGATGATGATGNANVQTYQYSIAPSDWASTTGNELYRNLIDNHETQSALDYGATMVYMAQPSSTTYWTALPNSYQNTEWGFQCSLNMVTILISWGSGFMPNTPTATYDYKVVVIPPAIKAAHPNTNWKNYNEVKQILNLPD